MIVLHHMIMRMNMENNTIKLLFSIVVVLMLIIIIILVKDMDYKTEASNYLINDNYYHVKYEPVDGYSKDGNFYEYAIFNGDNIILKESNLPYVPNIEWCENGILRVDIALGTNARKLRYCNVHTQTISKMFLVPSVYADFISYVYTDGISEFVNLFASFDYDENRDTVLVIFDIFEYRVIATIKRDFIAPTSGANSIIFLSEDTIYIDYDTIDSSDNRINKKEIIVFGINNNNIIITEQPQRL